MRDPKVMRYAPHLNEIGRIARFGAVGVLATLVYMGATFLAVELFGFSPVLASIFGQLTSIGVSYFGHALYSFGVVSAHRTHAWRFLVVAALTFGLNALVTWLLTSVAGVNYRVPTIIVAVLIPVTNYVFNRFWVFRSGIQSLDSGTANSRS